MILRILQRVHLPPSSPPRSPRLVRFSSSRSGSSSIWLTRHRQDPFVRDSTSSSFVSRSAFKLVELQQASRGKMIRRGMVVVDLGAAPGGWTQAARREMETKEMEKGSGSGASAVDWRGGKSSSTRREQGTIIAVDLLPLKKEVLELEGVHFIQGDFLAASTSSRILKLLPPYSKGKVDLVLSDMLENVSGNPLRDAQSSIDLCTATLQFALANLRESPPPPSTPLPSSSSSDSPKSNSKPAPKPKPPSPSLVMKCLQSSLSPEFNKLLKKHFQTVRWEKPHSSRPESKEGYFVCSGLLRREILEDEQRTGGEGGAGGKGKQKEMDKVEEEDGIYF